MIDIKIYGNICQVIGTTTNHVFFEGSLSDCRKYLRRVRANRARRERDQAMRDLGLKKYKGVTSGKTYWE